MNYRRIKAVAIAVLFLVAGVLYSAGRSQDIFLYESSQETGDEEDHSLGESDLQPADDAEAGSESGSGAGNAGNPAEAGEDRAFVEATEVPKVHVHVCGAVKKAGVYLLSANAIVEDAITAAGGAAKGGAVDYLNLAETVSEGDKIYVPFLEDLDDPYGVTTQSSGGTAGNADPSSEEGKSTLVNINTADRAQLMTLSGIGETRADAIISYRESNGSFQKIEDIMKVSGIKEGAFEKMKDQITV